MVEDYLFSPDLLDVDLDASSAKFNPKLTIKNPGEGLLLRPLSREVYLAFSTLDSLLCYAPWSAGLLIGLSQVPKSAGSYTSMLLPELLSTLLLLPLQ